MLGAMLAFLSSLASDLTAHLIIRKLNPLHLSPKTTTLGYLHDLEEKIREMPFIYKDLDSEVINDFVDVEFQSLDLSSLKLVTTRKINLGDDEKLKRNTRVLFLGNAGIGKTTFQRRTVISLIKQKYSLRGDDNLYKHLNERERPTRKA